METGMFQANHVNPATPTPTQTVAPAGASPLVAPALAPFGIARGFDPTNFDEVTMVIKGLSGAGKSTLLLSDPDTLVLDLEKMGQDAVHQRAMRTQNPILKFQAVLDICTALVKEAVAGRRPCKRVAFDTGDALEALIDAHLSAAQKTPVKDLPHGTGYKYIREEFIGLLNDLRQAGYAWTVSLHVAEKLISTGGTDNLSVVRTVLYNSLEKELYRHAQLIGEVVRDYVPVKAPDRVITTNNGKPITVEGKVTHHSPRHILRVKPFGSTGPPDQHRVFKCRYDQYMGDVELPLNGGMLAVQSAYDDAVAKAQRDRAVFQGATP